LTRRLWNMAKASPIPALLGKTPKRCCTNSQAPCAPAGPSQD